MPPGHLWVCTVLVKSLMPSLNAFPAAVSCQPLSAEVFSDMARLCSILFLFGDGRLSLRGKDRLTSVATVYQVVQVSEN